MGIDTGFRGSTSSIPGFPPPPPPGTEEETFTTHLPSRFDDMAADDLYGVSLPQSNGYPEGPQELYGTTLPKPLPELRNPPSTLPKKAPVPPPGPTPICPPPPAPPQFSPTSPERDFPPPPPPLQFADGSPKHNAPPTAPKPRRGSGPASPVFSAATMPPRHQEHAPPPPPLATMPRLTHAQPDVVPPPPVCSMPGDLLSNGGAPPPPPTSTIPRQLNRNVQSPPRAPSPPPLNSSSLAAQLARVQLRTAEVTEDGKYSFLKFCSVWNQNVACRLVAIAGATLLVSCHVINSPQLIWWLSTRRFHLRVPNIQMNCGDLNSRKGMGIVVPILAVRLKCLIGFTHILTHWCRLTHICICKLTIIGSDNSWSPYQRQSIIWNSAGSLLLRPLGTNFNEI